MQHNPILRTDSYKQSHHLQYPPGLTHLSSYIEARKGAPSGSVMFFGLQAFIKEYLSKPLTMADVVNAEELSLDHGVPFNSAGWRRIINQRGGWLPISISALREGVVVPRGTPLLQVENTVSGFAWLVSPLETALLRAIWYPSTVATASFNVKTMLYYAHLRSADTTDGLDFKLHDFGARGASSAETAALGGMAHLVNFKGTDTMEALEAARVYYDEPLAGYSIPASEHSTMTTWGRGSETDAYKNMIDEFGGAMFSIVSDSYDLWNAIENIYGKELKGKILNMKGKLIVRPDSGDPIAVPVRVLEMLWEIFGGTINTKGFKVLNPHVGVIQGDGLDPGKIGLLAHAVMKAGFSIDNIAFGMGGGLLQNHTRDSLRFAMKTNAARFNNGEWIDVSKDPATDPAKSSKAGRQAVVVDDDGKIITVRKDELNGRTNLLMDVFNNGALLYQDTFHEIRKRAYAGMTENYAENYRQDSVAA